MNGSPGIGVIARPVEVDAPQPRTGHCGPIYLWKDNQTGRGRYRRKPCRRWSCRWCRTRLQDEVYAKHGPAEPIEVERHWLEPERYPAFVKLVKRRGGGTLPIPAEDGMTVVLVIGVELGGERIDALTAIVAAVEERPADGRKIIPSALWTELIHAVAEDQDQGPDEEDGDLPDAAETFDPWLLEAGVEEGMGGTEPRYTPLGRLSIPYAEFIAVLQRYHLKPHTSFSKGGELAGDFDLPPEDSWDYIILTSELFRSNN